MGRRLMRWLLRAVGGSVVVLSTDGAQANGRYPATSQLVVAPSNSDVLVLRTTFGLLVSRDAGRTWGWVCETAIGFSGTEDPIVGVTSNGTVLAPLLEGLSVSPDGGCSWSFAPEIAGWTAADVAVRPNDPRSALALAWQESTDDAGVPSFDTRLFQTTDDGAHWALSGGAIDPTALITTLDVAASDPARVYACGVHGIYETADVPFYASHDGGQTFVRSAVPVDTNLESAAFIAGVDPTNADRVYVRTWPISRLLVSDDAGQSFRPVLTFAGEMQGFALSPDGRTVYAGGPSDGLWTADSTALSFQALTTAPIQCLTASGASLYACSDDTAFALGLSTDQGRSFTPVLHLSQVTGPLACAAGSPTAACASEFPSVCVTLRGCVLPEAGTPPAPLSDGGAASTDATAASAAPDATAASAALDATTSDASPASSAPVPSTRQSCTCRTAGSTSGGPDGPCGAAVAVALAAWMRRRTTRGLSFRRAADSRRVSREPMRDVP